MDATHLCIDCGDNQPEADAGATCPRCGGTIHRFVRAHSAAVVEAGLAHLDNTLVESDATGRAYRPHLLIGLDVEADEPVALQPATLTAGWSARTAPTFAPDQEADR